MKTKNKTDKELSFILEICKAYLGHKPYIKLDKDIVDHNSLWKLIQTHKLQAVFYSIIKVNDFTFSKLFLKKLSERSKKMVFSKLSQLREVVNIQLAHEKKGLCIIPYKGVAIGDLFYGNINLRDFNDVDFAIAQKDLKASASIMKSLGYSELKKPSDFEKLDRSRSFHIDYSWVKYDINGRVLCNAEIHWQATNSALLSPLKFRNLASKANTRKISSANIRLFNKVENAYLMILHHALVDGWFQLRHLVDLVVTIRALSSEELYILINRLSEEELLNSFYFGVQLSKELLQVELSRINVPKLTGFKYYRQAVSSGKLVGKWSSNKTKILYYLLLQDNNHQRFKSLSRFFKYLIIELRLKIISTNLVETS